jgi:hypothetical protein
MASPSGGNYGGIERFSKGRPELRLRRTVIALLGLTLPTVVLAQKIRDPDKVAPQYHDAAEKRRAEIIRTKMCTDKAEKEKVLKRDLAPYINGCIDAAEKAEAVEVLKLKQRHPRHAQTHPPAGRDGAEDKEINR